MRRNSSTSNSKLKIFPEILKALGMSALCLAVLIFLGRTYADAAGRNKINEWSKQRFVDFYQTERNTLDMVFVGSSHSYCSFDPEVIDPPLNLNSHQMSMPQQHPDATYYTLLDIFEYQSPSYIVMELYWDMLDEDFELKQVDTLFQAMENEKVQKRYINEGFPINQRIKYQVNALRFQQDFLNYENALLEEYMSERFGLVKKGADVNGQEYYRSKGFIFCDYVLEGEEYEKAKRAPVYDGKTFRIASNQEKYLREIIKLCNEQSAKLIFVTAPISNVSFEQVENYDAVHSTIAAFAEENGIEYLDFNLLNSGGALFADGEFRDKGHLNYQGALKCSRYLADWIKETIF